MNARRLEHFEALLRQERQRIIRVLGRALATAGTTADTTAGANGPPGDDAPAGSIGASPGDDDAIVAREQLNLREVDRALHLLLESPHDYGICARCGRPIPDERLELLPATRSCGRTPATD